MASPRLGGKTRWVHAGCVAPDGQEPAVENLQAADRDTIREEVASVFESRTPSVLRSTIGDEIEFVFESRITEAEERTKRIARASVEQFFDEMKPERIEIQRQDGTVFEIEETVHPSFRKVMDLAKMRKNIVLIGPAGSGKSYLARQVAYAIFGPADTWANPTEKIGMISCSGGMSEGHFIGRLLPVGEGGKFETVMADFRRCFQFGGVFLMDEMDAADDNVLLVMNDAIANGKLVLINDVGCPTIDKHPDFIFIGAANTYGRGADRMYCGRNALDEAFLDRFRIGQVEIDYSEEVDKALCPDDALRHRLQTYRRRVNENRLERIVSTRFLKDAYEMKVGAGWSDADIDGQLFMGWREDEIALVKN
jgi:MoxR-like ATPase